MSDVSKFHNSDDDLLEVRRALHAQTAGIDAEGQDGAPIDEDALAAHINARMPNPPY